MPFAAPLRIFQSALKAKGFIHDGVKTVITTYTATRPRSAGRTTLLSLAAGFTVTLPAATGSGNRYRFMCGVTATSNAYIIKVANATDVFVGGLLVNDTGDSTAATSDYFPTASTSDTITMTAAIGAGKKGDWVEFEDFAAGFFQVHGVLQGVTDPTSPFSATVS